MNPIPKPKDRKRYKTEPFKVMRGGREICADTPAGREEYRRRTLEAWKRDKGICGWCELPVSEEATTADHIKPRGMKGATRDDRISNIRPCHLWCNHEKGSLPFLTRREWVESKRGHRIDSSELDG